MSLIRKTKSSLVLPDEEVNGKFRSLASPRFPIRSFQNIPLDDDPSDLLRFVEFLNRFV